jgi:hypothetical protein
LAEKERGRPTLVPPAAATAPKKEPQRAGKDVAAKDTAAKSRKSKVV